MVTAELVAALDDLIQAGAQASASLRSKLEQVIGSNPQALPTLNQVAISQGVLGQVRDAPRTEQTVPQLLLKARDAVDRLSTIANQVGESSLANALKMRSQAITSQMQAAGVGTPWLTIMGVTAGVIAAYYLWKHFNKPKAMGTIEYPDDDVAPRVRQMGKVLGAFRGRASRSSCRKPKALGSAEYEFEPEQRLEGIHRGKRRIRSKV